MPSVASDATTTTNAMTTTNSTMATPTSIRLTKTSDSITTITTTKVDTTTALRDTLATSLSSAIQATTTPTATATKIKITSDPGILCFHHCNVKVFCFHLPHRCPKCKQILDTGDDVGGSDGCGKPAGAKGDVDEGEAHCASEADSNSRNSTTDDRFPGGGIGASTRLLPFRLPYPFIRASQYPCAIILRPTTGDFLNDYNNSTDLHIAVTTSTGCVVEFDRHGLRRHRADTVRMSDWWQCLLVGDVPEPWYDYWDDILKQICNQSDRWTIAHYQEDSHNCYTFVLAFLQALDYDKLSAAACSKTTFCEKYIVPRTTQAGKYISLYRKLRDTGVYVHPHPHSHHQHQRHSIFKQQQQQQLQQRQQKLYTNLQQEPKQPRGKSRINGFSNGSAGSATVLLANGGKLNGIILRAPNLCTIEE
ncbi:uncharacterized protein [Eurosta solidaginis]|uniref:uncharacterized protein n=1 Tax=Eurosta solidaginis TaxID=178769 RepID=UPI0035316CFD